MMKFVCNIKIKVVLVVLVMFNFFTLAQFAQKPKNVFEFELLMAEHSIGVQITMKHLMEQLLQSNDPSFQLLLQHKELIILRAQQHDFSKFSHTPEFIEKYYPSDNKQAHLGENIYLVYAQDIRNDSSISSDKKDNAIASFKAINNIDTQLLDELVKAYTQKNNIDAETVVNLKNQLDRFEKIADLLNRKMFENLLRFRRKVSLNEKKSDKETFEFGRIFDLVTYDKYYWHNKEDYLKAIRFYYSPTLWKSILNIDPNLVIATYKTQINDSPFTKSNKKRIDLEEAISNYLKTRSELRSIEQVWFYKNWQYRMVNQCVTFYK